MAYENIVVPDGEKITFEDGQLNVPDNPIVAFIEGDGIGIDITFGVFIDRGKGFGGEAVGNGIGDFIFGIDTVDVIVKWGKIAILILTDKGRMLILIFIRDVLISDPW